MKSAIIIVILCILCVLSANAWVGIIRSDPRSNHLSHCYSSSHNIGSMEKGEEKRLANQCAVARCRENRDIGLSGCGSVAIEPPCHIVKGDLSKPYPLCCYEIECPEGFRH
ncbi:unnamed protein product [Phaedon cochleariae]|uniref:Single domain-containing protein n=1 Tax=Phaedon cochleariae TaxID=80249 RepID=A0A9P0DRB3_PHACE|nr:unnamed protein product [Phaedon cochleariae]